MLSPSCPPLGRFLDGNSWECHRPSDSGLCHLNKGIHQRSVNKVESLGWVLSVIATVCNGF